MPFKKKHVPAVSSFINKKTKEPITVASLLYAIPWENIEKVMYAKDYRKFCKFMEGQTSDAQGAYIVDVQRFLRGETGLAD